MKILNLDGLKHLVDNIKNLVNTSAENTLKSSKEYTDENVELIKNQILDPDNYGTSSSEDGGVIVVDFKQGYISTSTGEEGDTEGHLITDFILVDNDKFTLYSDAYTESAIRVFVYDADKNWLSTANEVGYYRVNNGEKADITNNAKYIRCRVSTTATLGTLTVTFDDVVVTDCAIHQKIYFNNGYNMESTLIEDDLYQLQVNAEENEFNIFTIAAPKNKASEATLALMLNDEEKTQFVDLSCMKYNKDEDGTFSTILQSRGDTPLPSYVLGFNDGKGAGRVRKLEITPDAVPMQFVSNGIRVRKDNAYDNNWSDDNSVVVNLAELSTKGDDLQNQIASLGDTYYTEIEVDDLITGINTSIDNIVSGSTPVKKAEHATSADSAISSTNADTVDGCHASEFQKSMDFPQINTNVLEYAENYPTTNVNGTFFTCRIFNGYNEPNATEGVVGSGDYYYCMHKIDSSWITILAIDVRSWNMYVINKHSGTWGVWRNISDGGNADTVDNVHAWQMQTLDTNGNPHGSNDWLMQVRHNLDGDGYFKIACGDGSVGTKVDLAHASNYASNAITATSSIYSNYLSGWSDTRHENTAPNDYNGKFYIKGLKINEAINSPDNSSFSSVLGFRSWADASGGQAHELAFTGNGQMFQRHGDTDIWSSWNRFYTSENLTYGTSELIAGSSSLPTGNFYFQYE